MNAPTFILTSVPSRTTAASTILSSLHGCDVEPKPRLAASSGLISNQLNSHSVHQTSLKCSPEQFPSPHNESRCQGDINGASPPHRQKAFHMLTSGGIHFCRSLLFSSTGDCGGIQQITQNTIYLGNELSHIESLAQRAHMESCRFLK